MLPLRYHPFKYHLCILILIINLLARTNPPPGLHQPPQDPHNACLSELCQCKFVSDKNHRYPALIVLQHASVNGFVESP